MSVPQIEQRLIAKGVPAEIASAIVMDVLKGRVRREFEPHLAAE
jgi:hypothetical protein